MTTTAFWFPGLANTHLQTREMSAVLTHTIDKIWYIPSPSATTREKSLLLKTYQKMSALNLNYPNGELQSWLILNTKLERDGFDSYTYSTA